jgi:hypothetical protein
MEIMMTGSSEDICLFACSPQSPGDTWQLCHAPKCGCWSPSDTWRPRCYPQPWGHVAAPALSPTVRTHGSLGAVLSREAEAVVLTWSLYVRYPVLRVPTFCVDMATTSTGGPKVRAPRTRQGHWARRHKNRRKNYLQSNFKFISLQSHSNNYKMIINSWILSQAVNIFPPKQQQYLLVARCYAFAVWTNTTLVALYVIDFF